MADLFNEFSWSVSRDSLFRSCRRAYYYQYYGSWGGWDANAEPRIRQLYILKNLKNLPIWSGTIVHDVVAEALREYSRSRHPITADGLKARGREKLRQGWTEATRQEWQQAPKKTNLDELYYGNGKTLPAEKTEAVKAKVYGCLEAFATSPLLGEILAAPFIHWKPVDQLDTFVIDRLKVWCAIDFAYHDAAGILRLIDWKTGAEKTEAISLQLACYAYYARDKWGAMPSQVRIFGCFLGDQARLSEYPLAPETLVDARQAMLASAAAMQECLIDPAANRAREEDFPFCENDRACRFCAYREVCPRPGKGPGAGR